jgi:SET domain-containing protein
MQWTEFSAVLKPSLISGVGVFAAHEIPAGVRVFPKFAPMIRKVADVPSEFISYCILINKDECLSPQEFDHMELGWYLNHSNNPNVAKRADGNLYTLRKIEDGEEILVNYNQYNESQDLKDSCCKN